MANKKCSPMYFCIPGMPQDKPLDSNSSAPNKLKVVVDHDDGGASLSGTRKRGIKVRFTEVAKYPDSLFETMFLFNAKHACVYPLIELNRVNPKKLAKVDEIIKANGDKLAEMWFAGMRSQLLTYMLDLVKGV